MSLLVGLHLDVNIESYGTLNWAWKASVGGSSNISHTHEGTQKKRIDGWKFSLIFFWFLSWHYDLFMQYYLDGPFTASFSFIFGLFNQVMQFLQQINVKNANPVANARTWTHNLLIMSLLT